MNKPEEKMNLLKKLVFLSLVIPVSLMALETVNLIKNHSFENEDGVWETYTGTFQPTENDSAVADAHDSNDFYTGFFSASSETRSQPGDPTPPPTLFDSAVVIQGLPQNKLLNDLDSLHWEMKIIPLGFTVDSSALVRISLLFDSEDEFWIWATYDYPNPKYSPVSDQPHRVSFHNDFPSDTLWLNYHKALKSDFIDTKGLLPNAVLDSLALTGYGFDDPTWLGQKVYWDDIRLMGYADYDVGIKEILSGNELEVDSPYTPIARIKNFGREDAEEFNVIAEVWDGETLIYEETIPHTLPGDTEDTLEFPPFTPTYMTTYTLTIRTEMVTPAIDECDEDDQLSKTIGQTGISEDEIPQSSPYLEVTAITGGVLTVYFKTPERQIANLTLYDATGRRIDRQTVTGAGSTIIPALPSGVYFVRLSTYFRRITRKVVLR